MDISLRDKVALVTGASRGIGRQIALTLAGSGAYVVVNYNGSADAAKAVVNAIEADGGRAEACQCCVSDFEAVGEMIQTLAKKHGHIDILVNNAGITRDELVLKMREKDFDDVIATNLKGSFNTMRHISRQMLRQRGGCVVNIASVSGILGNPGQMNYCASKAGVIGMTKTMARELASRDIRVNAVAPGFVDTEMTKGMDAAAREEGIARVPLGKIGKPRDIASAVAFLVSDEASYITGQVLCVDGGMATRD